MIFGICSTLVPISVLDITSSTYLLSINNYYQPIEITNRFVSYFISLITRNIIKKYIPSSNSWNELS